MLLTTSESLCLLKTGYLAATFFLPKTGLQALKTQFAAQPDLAVPVIKACTEYRQVTVLMRLTAAVLPKLRFFRSRQFLFSISCPHPFTKS